MKRESVVLPWFGTVLGRCVLGFLAFASLAGCGTQVDGLRVAWADKGGSPVLATSDLAQCPDMAGIYLTQGRVIESSSKHPHPANMHMLLAEHLVVRGMERAVPGAWESAPAATVTWRATDDGWSIRSDDSQGATQEGRIRKLNGAADPERQSMEFANRGFGPDRSNGCTDGRLWMATTSTWSQYESLSNVRYVAVLRPEQGGLRVSLLSERRSLGLLPWWSGSEDTAQYWFDRAPATP